jgi:ParB family chromosome partitioning protein
LKPNSLSGFLEELDIKRIHPALRALRSELGGLDELTASIMEKGLLQPIVVRPVDNGFEVVAGNRRLEACRRLGMSRIPCHIVDFEDKEAYEASLIENIQHRTLNPIEEAKAFKKYVDEYGYGGVSELAKKIGMSQPYVSRRIALLDLPIEVQEQLMRQRIPASTAQELLSLDKQDRRELTELIIEKKVTRTEFRRFVRRVKEGIEAGPTVSYYLEAEKRMCGIDRAFARCIASLKVSMMRFDDVLDYVDEDEWVVKEMLMQQRIFIHQQIDNLLKLKKKVHRTPPPIV